MRFEIFPIFKMDGSKEWAYRLVGRNGEIVMSAEGHKNKADCYSIIKSIRWNALFAKVTEVLK